MSNIRVTYRAINEVYCMLQAYLREGKLNGKYENEVIEEFVEQLHTILKMQPPVESADIEEVAEV